MTISHEGKAAVLAALDEDARARTGKPGVYMLSDEAGKPHLVILAGHVFGGTHQTTGKDFPPMEFKVEDGLIVEATLVG